MAVRVGRATGLELTETRRDGMSLALTGYILGATVAELKARRQQLLGLDENPDELRIPVTLSDDPTLDDFYKVRSVAVDRIGVDSRRYAGYRVVLDRENAAQRAVESVTTLSLTPNGHSIVATNGAFAVPAAAVNVRWPTVAGASLTNVWTRAGDDGDLQLRYTTGGVGSFLLTPAEFYNGGVRLEAQFGDSTWWPVVGRSVPITATAWRLTNGLVRFQSTVTSGFALEMEVFAGGAWVDTKPLKFSRQITPTPTPPDPYVNYDYVQLAAVSVLRNAPEAAAVRLTFTPTVTSGGTGPNVGAAQTRWEVDLYLQRGYRLGRFTFEGAGSFLRVHVGSSSIPGTVITGGIHQTTATGNGSRVVVGWPDTISGTDAQVVSSGAVNNPIGSCAVGYALASSPNLPAEILPTEYYTALARSDRLVLR